MHVDGMQYKINLFYGILIGLPYIFLKWVFLNYSMSYQKIYLKLQKIQVKNVEYSMNCWNQIA